MSVMLPLEPPTGPLQTPEVVVCTGLLLLGVLSMFQFTRARVAHPPNWVRGYFKGNNVVLSQQIGAVFLMTMPWATLTRNVHNPVVRVVVLLLSVVSLLSMVLYPVASIFWYPRFLLPLWYRRGKRAGVPVNNPEAMEHFRQLPVEKQRELADDKGWDAYVRLTLTPRVLGTKEST